MRPNHLLRAIKAGEQSVGGWLSIDSSFTAEIMSHLGFDWLCLDMQHGPLSYDSAKSMLTAISTTDTVPLVRVSGVEPSEIMRVLDAGAYGVIVPMVNSAEEAVRAVSSCKYPPLGTRSFGPNRAALYGGKDYSTKANDELACIVMIETLEAMENLDQIMATPGVDGVFIGPADLSLALGMTSSKDADGSGLSALIDEIFDRANKHAIGTGIYASNIDFAMRYLEQGFNMVTIGSDSSFMSRLAFKELRTVRAKFGSSG